jgi:hypothetical protein
MRKLILMLAVSVAASTITMAQSPGARQAELRAGSGADSIVTGHFNRDRQLDIAVANRNADTISVFLGRGNGKFAPARTFATGPSPRSLRAADVNNDGNLDLLTANAEGNTVSLLLGTGRGGFLRDDVPTCESCNPLAIETGDFNGDTNVDIALAFVGSNQIGMLLGHGDATFDLIHPANQGQMRDDPQWLESGDFNRDGRLDLAAANLDPFLSTAQGNGDGTFGPGPEYPTGSSSLSLAAADVNGDRILDIIVANQNRNTASVFLGDGAGNFVLATELETGARPVFVAVADLNRDGRNDVAVANFDSDTISIFPGNGNGTFAARMDLATGDGPAGIAAGDFNRDRRADLAVTNRNEGTVSVFFSSRRH